MVEISNIVEYAAKKTVSFLILNKKKNLLFIPNVLATRVSVDILDVTESAAKRETTMLDSQVLILPVVLVVSATVDISKGVVSATKSNDITFDIE